MSGCAPRNDRLQGLEFRNFLGDGERLEFVEHLLQLGAVGGDSQAQHEQ